jgi:hypothetical protein
MPHPLLASAAFMLVARVVIAGAILALVAVFARRK